MKENNIKNAEKALTITTILTFFVASFEVFMAFSHYEEGMNIFDIASYVTANSNIYCIILILGNLILLPSVIMLYKQNNISIKDEIFDKKTLSKDILYGIVALAITVILDIAFGFVFNNGRTNLANTVTNISIGTIIMRIIALTFVSGICKEIYFRGIAKKFCGTVLGETTALLLFNIMFAMLDWFNLGFSFIAGLVWIWAYKKTNHLITPMIAHGTINFIIIIYMILTIGVM